jgi:hypothetical protein
MELKKTKGKFTIRDVNKPLLITENTRYKINKDIGELKTSYQDVTNI